MKIPAFIFSAIALFFIGCNQSNDKTAIKQPKSNYQNFIQLAEGEQLFNSKCMICHIKTKPTKEQIGNLSAPPITAVAFHLKKEFSDSNKIIDRASAAAFVVDYVLFPDKSKAICNADRISAFGIMPSLKGSVTEDELSQISDYILDNYPLAGPYKPIK